MKIQEIKPASIWNKERSKALGEFILGESLKQSKERILANEMLAIRFMIEDYINSKTPAKKKRVYDFVILYLESLQATQKSLADLFGMKSSNLYKYLVGERKLNGDLILKLSAFSELEPEYWIRIEVKNELIDLPKEKKTDLRKYNYRKLLQTA
jgi:antitoxin HigA-1